MKHGLSAAFHTLGCKVNQQETAAIEAVFVQENFSVVSFATVADVYVINSCVVTAQAERKSRAVVRRIRSRAPDSLIVLAGCLPQVAGADSLETGADILVGSNDKSKIIELVRSSLEGHHPQIISVSPLDAGTGFERIADGSEADRTRAFLKVQDGCQEFCRYCIIPYARGPERSLPLAEVIALARQFVEKGYREIVLTGIHLGAYGRDLPGKTGLTFLAEEILRQTTLQRLRFGSLEPNDIDAGLMETMRRSDRICRHLHIPLQSGCDRTLARMGRRYSTLEYSSLIHRLRSDLPLIGISTDIIAGFPGESEEDHLASESFLREIAPLRAHVFRYSRRTGTPAAEMKAQVPEAIKAQRAARLVEIARESALFNHRAYLGETLQVLIEGQEKGLLKGHSSQYVNVSARGPRVNRGSVVSVLVESAVEKGVCGRLVQE